ncbi:MAG: DUF3147 family protein [Litorimonas sp.]
MIYFIIKAALSGFLIALIAEVGKRYPSLGGVVASLPLISLLAIIWLWRDTGGDVGQVTALIRATLWYILPTLPFFLIVPVMLERGLNFWVSLLIASFITICLYLAASWIAARFGMAFQKGPQL